MSAFVSLKIFFQSKLNLIIKQLFMLEEAYNKCINVSQALTVH